MLFDVPFNLITGSFTDRGHKVAWIPHMPSPQLAFQLRMIEKQSSGRVSLEHPDCVRGPELWLAVQKSGLASDISYTIRYGTEENTHIHDHA